MTQIINLNKARKQRKKQADLKTARQNRVKSGLPKPARDAARHEREKQAGKLDAVRLPPDPDQKTSTT